VRESGESFGAYPVSKMSAERIRRLCSTGLTRFHAGKSKYRKLAKVARFPLHGSNHRRGVFPQRGGQVDPPADGLVAVMGWHQQLTDSACLGVAGLEL
jgi:hypothetical protein